MRTFPFLPVVVLLVAVAPGCPLMRGQRTPATPPPVSAAPPVAKESAPPFEESVPAALKEARAEDLPILTPVLDYLSSKAVDEEISGLKDMRWLCVEDVLSGKVSDEDPDNLTVIYKVVKQDDRIAVRVGPPKSELDLEFRVTEKEGGGYMYVGWEPMPAPGEP